MQRTREVIDIPVVPFQVTEQVFIARICPVCQRRRVPRADLNGVAVGRQRLGINLVSLISALREEGRLPVRAVQWYLRTVHQLHLSVGAIVGVTHGVAQRAQRVLAQVLAQVLDRIRASPVVHADETGWRQDGANGYVWTFATPAERYFLRRGRNKEVVDEALGESFSGVLVSDFYAAYNHYPGPKSGAGHTCCGTSTTLGPCTPRTKSWPGGRRTSTGCGNWRRTSPILRQSNARQSNARQSNAGWLKMGLSRGCWPDANRSWRTHRRSKTNSAGASKSTLRNCSFLWPRLKRHRTTTPPKGASAIW